MTPLSDFETESPLGDTPEEDVACADCGWYATLFGPMDFDGDRHEPGDFVCERCAVRRGAEA